MSANDLIHQFQFNQMTLTRLLADVSQEDSLRVPVASANSINWIVGHLIATRAGMIASLGGEPHWTKEQSLRYKPIPKGWTESHALDIAELRKVLDESLHRIESTLRAGESSLDDPSNSRLPHLAEGGTRRDTVGTFICHEAYHIGQIGLQRRLLSKPGLF